MIYYEKGSADEVIGSESLKAAVFTTLEKLGRRKKVLVVPPDCTRFHSRAGEVTTYIYKYYKDDLKDILPALGTHSPMTGTQIRDMFREVPESLFRVHDWRHDVVTAGIVPGSFVSQITEGALDYDWPAQLNKLVLNGGHDLILSVGQVVPHEVIGMANYNKNLFVGTGGHEGINKSHFIGAVYGMERIMGKASNPVRSLLNYASDNFIKDLPVVYIQTVIGRDTQGELVIRGLFIGDDEETFLKAAELSLKVNFNIVGKPLKRVLVYLDPAEYKSTWLGNKSIYRTRMAMADDGELTVVAPGLKEFGEDKEIDRLIRKYGYHGTKQVLADLKDNEDLRLNLSAAAHLIHGSTEGRFNVTYCPGHLTKDEIEAAGYNYMRPGDIDYKIKDLKEGINFSGTEKEVFYISNPALGLWSSKERIN